MQEKKQLVRVSGEDNNPMSTCAPSVFQEVAMGPIQR